MVISDDNSDHSNTILSKFERMNRKTVSQSPMTPDMHCGDAADPMHSDVFSIGFELSKPSSETSGIP